MKKLIISSIAILLLAGCSGMKEPAEFGGNWVAINSYTENIETIPRFKAYAFEASKLDGSLIGLLTRWANDAKLAYEFSCKNDFSLPIVVEKISEPTLIGAIQKLNNIYVSKNIAIYTDSANKLIYSCDTPASNVSSADDKFLTAY